MKVINRINIDELKVVYFDADGVLSVPVYPLGPHGEDVPFAEDAKWENFVHGNVNAYDACEVPTAILSWMRELKRHGISIRVLSASVPPEEPSKLKFLKERYGDLLDEIIIVPSAKDKVPRMLEDQKKFGYERFEMALVEDNHYTLFETSEYGFRGIHVTWFMDVES